MTRILAILALVCLLGGFAAGYRYRDARADVQVAALNAKAAKDHANAQKAVRAIEGAWAEEVWKLQGQIDKQRAANEAAQKRIVDDLLSARIKLRERWRGCVPGAAQGAGESDAAARDRAESAGRAIRAADDADATICALQNFLRVERKQPVVECPKP